MAITIFIAFFGTLLAIAFLRPLSVRLHLVDYPNQRKQHVGAIPLIGGLSICIGIYLSVFLTLPLENVSAIMLGCAGFMAVMGAVDDAKDLSPWLRLSLQALFTFILCLITDISLHQFGDVVGVGNLTIPHPSMSLCLAIISVCAIMNAYNMMDGIDGLAGSMAGITLLGLATLFSSLMPVMSNICLVIVAALIPYLVTNLSIPPFKRKIFLGDAGTMFLGFIIGYLVLLGTQHSESIIVFRPVTALWLIGLPLMDMVGVMMRRVCKRQSPLRPDRNHMHHIFLHAGFTARESLLLMFFVNLVIIVFGVFAELEQFPEWLMMGLYLLLFAAYLLGLVHAWRFGCWMSRIKTGKAAC